MGFCNCRASYRDLLGTAESIIEMDDKIHRVEALMGEMGRKCNTRIVERKAVNLRKWDRERGAKGALGFCLESLVKADT